jgi:acyl-CoA reductase-like NAD-dependent aldehyde dehydrogenase
MENEMEYKLVDRRSSGSGSGTPLEVKNKYDAFETVGVVTTATKDDLNRAIDAAERAEDVMADMPAHKRAEILLNAPLSLDARDALTTLPRPSPLKRARRSSLRAPKWIARQHVFTIAAEEAKRLHGETIPLDAVPSGEGYFGFWTRRPVGVIAAISPFNFPIQFGRS